MTDRGFTVSEDQADRRLDRVLRGIYRSVPLGAIMKAIRTGAVRVDGRRAAQDARLEAGSVVSVPWDDGERTTTAKIAEPKKSATKAGELRVISRGEQAICVEKPAGMLSQPDRRGGESLVGAIWRLLAWDRDDFRPAIVGRLDRNVSGAVIAALSAPALRSLSSVFRERRATKIYTAVVLGTPPRSGEVDAPLRKDERRGIASIDPTGAPALTRYRLLRSGGHLSIVELELVTGRYHQARAHMAHIGCPIVGDAKYGGITPHGARRRVYLHASMIGLPDDPSLPAELRGARFDCPAPRYFESLLGR